MRYIKKKYINYKKASLIITGLISIFLIIFTLSYSFSTKFVSNNNSQTSLNQQQQSEIKNQADSKDNSSLNDLKFGGGDQIGSSLSNAPITLSDGSYVITTNSGIAKVSPFGTFLYSYSFTNLPMNSFTESFKNYETRQVVQNYLDPSLFYLLIYSPDVSFNTLQDPTTWKNPGYVLTIKDSGSDFSLLNSTALLLPAKADITLLSYLIFSPTLVGPGTTDADINDIVNNGSSSPLLNDKWVAPADETKKAVGINYDKSVVENMYLNNLNNMVFIGGDIFIFGGNDLPNFWFWSFKTSNTNNASSVNAKLYLNVGVTWPTNAKYATPNIVDGSDWTYFLRFHDGGTGTAGWDPNGQYNYPSFSVAGAKTIAQNNYVNGQIVSTSYSVQALFVLPGFIYLQKDSRLQSAFLNVPYKYERRVCYFLLSMDSTRANSIANGSTSERLFNQSTFGIDDTSLDFSPTTDPDGYINSLTNKVYGFDIETIEPKDGNGLDSVNALIFFRDAFARIIYDPNSLLPVTEPKYDDPTVALAKEYKIKITGKSKINQSNTQQIIFNKNVWYLLINNGSSTDIVAADLSGSYVPEQNSNDISPPSQIGLSFQSITAPQGSEIFGLLPLSDNFIYALIKDGTTNDVTVSLFNRNSLQTPYEIDNAYVYKPEFPTYANNSSIWGTITIKDENYLNNAGYFSYTAVEIANNSQKLQNIITFTPAWDGQTAKVTAPADISDLTKLPITINVQYFNNKFYNNQSFNQSLGFPDTTLTGLSSTPSWVIPVAVGVSVSALAIIIILGLGFGIPMAKNRKLQNKGFSQALKKVDTLTAAVGSVYKKIAKQTSVIKKNQKMLKGSQPTNTVKSAPALTNTIPFNTSTVQFNTAPIMTNNVSYNANTTPVMTNRIQFNTTPVMTNNLAFNKTTAPVMTNQIVNRPIAPPRRPVQGPRRPVQPPQRPY